MKATDVIARDHRAAEAMFEKFKAATGDEKRTIEHELFAALNAHELMEDTRFFPALKDKAEGNEALKEVLHEQTTLKFDAMGAHMLEMFTGTHEERVERIMEKVLAHAKKEEAEIFPLAEEAFSAEELEELGAKMEPMSAVSVTSKLEGKD